MKNMFIFIIMVSSLFTSTFADDYIDTQYGPDGIEVHLLKVSEANNVLTVSFMLDNTSGDKVKFVSMAIENVLYTTTDTKYPVLKDVDGKYLASTITYDEGAVNGFIFAVHASQYKSLSLKDGAKKVGWIKFEAPNADDWPIEVSLPGVSPFTIEKPER